MQLLKGNFHTYDGSKKSLINIIFVFSFILITVVLVTSCFYGSPDKPGTTTTAVVYPTSEGKMVSEDSRVVIEFEAGTVPRPTTFSITKIPKENYPEQYLLRSDVYEIEPSKDLLKPVKITVYLAELDGENFDMQAAYNLNAIKLRQMTPGGYPAFLDTEETNIVDINGNSHHVLIRETDSPVAFGIFVSGCYAMCLKMETCSSHVITDTGKTLRERIFDCMVDYSCTDFENLNNEDNEAKFLCSYTRSCHYSFTCCQQDPYCEGETDGDDDAETVDGDDDTIIDGDEDEVDQEEEIEDTRFDVETCVSKQDCSDAGMECVINPKLDNAQTGYCLNISPQPLQGYVYNDDTSEWTLQDSNNISLQCAGDVPNEDASGDSTVDIKIVLDDWWDYAHKENVKVELFFEDDLESPVYQGFLDANGEFLIDDSVAVDEWFVVKLSRTDDDPSKAVVPTYTWGNFITQKEAKDINDQNSSVYLPVMAVDQNRRKVFAQLLNISENELDGYGIVMGQVEDCNGTPKYKLKNATVGFLEAKPIKMAYFQDQTSPTPSSTAEYTTQNGLFAAIYLPPAKSLTAFATGKKQTGDTVETELIAITAENHLRVIADSVSIVRFNAFH